MEIKEGHIFDFNGEYKLASCKPKEDGFYMTIRCGLGGIYHMLDEWKDDQWKVGVTDASSVIAYSREQIPKETADAWAREKIRAYKAKQSKETKNGKNMSDTELLALCKSWFEEIADRCDGLTSGNISHRVKFLKGLAKNAAELVNEQLK